MAELRRIQLTTLSSNVPLPASLLKIPAKEDGAVAAALQNGKVETSLRLVLALFEPDQRRCPEFYYPELVKKKSNAIKESSKSLEGESQKEVEALAKKFEEKYGGSKRKKDRMQDLVDMGYGYDETDSFIDNSEAYDELVPASLTTKYGGFYINSGTLQFRQASESEGDDHINDEKKKLKSPKRKKLKEGDVKSVKKRKEGQHKKCKMAKTGIVPLNATEERKKKKHSGTVAVSEMLKRFEKAKESLPREEAKPAPSVAPLNREVDVGLNVTDPLLSLIGSTNESDLLQAASTIDFDIDLDKLLYESPEPSPPGLDENSDPMAVGQPLKQPPPFPEGLHPALEKRIRDLTQAAKGSEGEGKQKFFTQDVNSMLLDIEIQSRELSSPVRSGIYVYLASFLPCSKDTLLKRAKKLHLHEQDGRLKEPLQKLKEAIGRSMPEQIAKYQEECQAHTQAKFAKMLEEGKEKEKVVSDEDEDEEKTGKRVMGPRKKFQWNEEIRHFLCTVVELKIGRYELERNKSQSAEEYLKAFLEAEVKPLWPKGWMQARTLFKETRRVHGHMTCMPTKKKVVTSPKMKTKEPLVKLEKKCPALPGSVAPPVLMPTSGGLLSLSNVAAPCPSSVVPSHAFTMDDSLDGDLIHNPPSLGAVSEELAALNHDGRGGGDFCFPLTCKPSLDIGPPEERKSTLKQSSATGAPSQSPLNLLAEQALTHGQITPDRKANGTQLLVIPAYKDVAASPKTLSSQMLADGVQAKAKSYALPKATQPTPSNPVPSLAPKSFLQHNQHQKGFPTTMQFGLGNLLSGAQGKAPKYAPACPGIQSPVSKGQAFLGHPSAPPSVAAVTSINLGKMAAPQSYLPKPHSSTNPSPPFQPTFSLPAVTKPGASQSRLVQSVPGSLPSVTSVIASHKSPSPNQVLAVSPLPSTPPKKITSQKLTLVAPPCGENGDSGNGSQGVARLLTSSLNATAVPSASAPVPAGVKSTSAPTLSSPASSSLSLLSMGSTSLGTAGTLGILPAIVPMHTFSFPVLSFGPDSAAPSLGSKDAVITGPAPGTFNHGLAHSLFASLRSSPVHPPQLAQSTLSHLQQSLQDGSQVHGEVPNAQRKVQ
ncbi:ubinuclein-1 isoform X1 [Paramormyrops kingsleyae]|uniref:Ubinuclein 1 n=1 Tax=Paramormyrops kingsleyae TaxID=1676925 RepID=A0A3B3SJC8_9TELE|nr:ubinuclein-1 isoform X1 [Paramormyrops kingsleyae]XP_023694694.1 ubinuclein-1 isoform X1 [Paramormyrops kingsleyae]